MKKTLYARPLRTNGLPLEENFNSSVVKLIERNSGILWASVVH
jgi:hypothetical protein